jgi:hypothetical protein
MQVVAIFSTLGFIYIQVRLQTASHVVSTINIINNRWESEVALKARYMACESYLAGNREFKAVDQKVAELLEEIGVIVHIKAVPKKIIWETHSWYIEHYYPMFEIGIQQYRKKYGDKHLYSEFEWLHLELKKVSRKKGLPEIERNGKEVEMFEEGELETIQTQLSLTRLIHQDDV